MKHFVLRMNSNLSPARCLDSSGAANKVCAPKCHVSGEKGSTFLLRVILWNNTQGEKKNERNSCTILEGKCTFGFLHSFLRSNNHNSPTGMSVGRLLVLLIELFARKYSVVRCSRVVMGTSNVSQELLWKQRARLARNHVDRREEEKKNRKKTNKQMSCFVKAPFFLQARRSTLCPACFMYGS